MQDSGISSRVKANGRIQNDQLFMRGSAMSGAPIIIGIIQLARPTKAGITAPKIITSACMVVIWLKNSGSTNCRPGLEQFGADDHRHRAADEEHDQREHQVQRADVLVVGREEPALEEALLVAVIVVVVGVVAAL